MAESSVIQVLEGLPTALRVTRLARGCSLRKVARELDVSFSTIYRIEAGEDCNLSSAIAVLRWIAKQGDQIEADCNGQDLQP